MAAIQKRIPMPVEILNEFIFTGSPDEYNESRGICICPILPAVGKIKPPVFARYIFLLISVFNNGPGPKYTNQTNNFTPTQTHHS
jgi:hypothetical protein